MPKDPDAGLSLIRIYDQLENYIGKELYFVIENGNETGFSFINVDDFRTYMTEKEVIALQNETMAALITMEDPYKEYIVSSYKEEEIIPFGRTICFDLNGGEGICPAPIRSYDAKAIRLPDGTSMNRANHILLGWAETRNTNVIDPATNEDAYAQIIYMPGSSYPIQDKDVTLYAV